MGSKAQIVSQPRVLSCERTEFVYVSMDGFVCNLCQDKQMWQANWLPVSGKGATSMRAASLNFTLPQYTVAIIIATNMFEA